MRHPSTDVERRLRGADVRWSRNWDESFDQLLLDWITSTLGKPVARRAR